MTDHPAKYPRYLLPMLQELLPVSEYPSVLDPFAGTGRIHELANKTIGVELEPEWASMHPDTIVGNALNLPFKDGSVSAAATSPCYGNRMADSHVAKDDSKRHTYTHTLGRKLHDDNAGAMQWGNEYRTFHELAWKELARVLEPDGRFVLNVKDHIRGGEVQHVAGWHVTTLSRIGFTLEDAVPAKARGLLHGEHYDLRTPTEWLFVLRKDA